MEADRNARPRYTWKLAQTQWREDGTAGLKERTLGRYLTSLSAVRSILEDLWLDEIGKAVLHRIASRPGVTNATRKRDLTAVSAVLKAAEDRGWINTAPTYPFRRLRELREPVRLPTAPEIERLHTKLSPMLSRLVRLLEQTGMRLEEAGGLTWEQCDRRRRTITLHHTKASRTRTLELSADAVVTLFGTPRRLGCGLVFWVGKDKPHRYGDLSGLLYDIRKAAKVPWRIHDLRHLYAVRYLKAGGSLYALQKLLGHASINVTEGYLDHLTPAEQERAKQTAS